MAITTRSRVGDVFCMASGRTITTNPKPLTESHITNRQAVKRNRQAGSMFLTLPDRTDCFCGLVSIVAIQNQDPYHTI